MRSTVQIFKRIDRKFALTEWKKSIFGSCRADKYPAVLWSVNLTGSADRNLGDVPSQKTFITHLTQSNRFSDHTTGYQKNKKKSECVTLVSNWPTFLQLSKQSKSTWERVENNPFQPCEVYFRLFFHARFARSTFQTNFGAFKGTIISKKSILYLLEFEDTVSRTRSRVWNINVQLEPTPLHLPDISILNSRTALPTFVGHMWQLTAMADNFKNVTCHFPVSPSFLLLVPEILH